ncbi:AAA domain-containing protein [Mesorhizobium sp. J18]|uniref:ATP-binding protein n=1 Tax=Mesorhizobium sp. J18 TaxID=935263 RepID=UPI001199941A|nr:ATP-binding protein [Mesorhizobium sp. J18]TWG90363.1 AAA domain-containing protein [Mesorhizobium sp. J18]
MALKITKSTDPIKVDRLNMVIYSPPGLGKTSLAFTAEAPLLLDFDAGSHRAARRKDAVRVSDWSDVASINAEDLSPYKTVIMDTAGRALDALTVDIIRANPKHGRGGALTLQGYGELKARFIAFLKLLNSFGKDVVLIAHMDEQRNGDDVIERLDVQGGSKNEIYKAADAMGRLSMVNGKLLLRFSPSDAAFGKNPGQLEPLTVPHFSSPEFEGFLGSVIQRTKDRLNELSEEQQAAVEEQKWFKDTLPNVSDAEGINSLIGRASGGGVACKALLAARAKEIGLIFDKAKGEYVEGQKEAA